MFNIRAHITWRKVGLTLMLAVLALALVATGGEIEAQQVPDYPGTSRILSIGGWSNIFTLEDRLIAVHYEATEVPPPDAIGSGTEKWSISISDTNGIIEVKFVPVLGVNVAVFYLEPIEDRMGSPVPQVLFGDEIIVTLRENPIIFPTVSSPLARAVPWRVNGDVAGRDIARANLGNWVLQVMSVTEGIDNSTATFIEEGKLTAEGFSYLARGYPFWRTAIAAILIDAIVGLGEDFNPDTTSFTRSDQIRAEAQQTGIYKGLTDIGAIYGFGPLATGIVLLVSLIVFATFGILFMRGDPVHTLPFLGMLLLLMSLAGFFSLQGMAVLSSLLAFAGSLVIIVKYAPN